MLLAARVRVPDEGPVPADGGDAFAIGGQGDGEQTVGRDLPLLAGGQVEEDSVLPCQPPVARCLPSAEKAM